MNQDNNKYSYYTNFTTQMFLGAKEILKSMPAFYNQIYFSTKYATALWSGDKEEVFQNITILTEAQNVERLRNIIKNNFLYIWQWDSIRFTNGEDYGFSFIAGNIKYILLCFTETNEGYAIRSYDVDTGNCYDTNVNVDKRYFLSTNMKENGEFVRICDFNLDYITENNTKVTRAAKKAQPELVSIQNSRGYAITNMYLFMILSVICILVVYIAYAWIKFVHLG